ncbi:Golgi resident protein GCP60-like isoform X2 [Amphibalanus amphitrite]|uniref:Golgi resident protein GCP60-like isoform X1 n=1 Tax=Amphibalanus amphitrite TaxID=1232801 RepID=UPI001C927CEF|nr:Golgi resident protein GCP60-like isoform X1 [Amphibalanus amphitrite]XP_043244164.1 Golgi resident protein GCP60-like isoform X1 [Amphibalanus amphitrite]XP_043244165.1 Golgi resident protein GCP60-like isoform X1 [Amphibalanus amphitrite]XP_043244166.1 Golgi resident protein GCP60-like isoform X1 [Amphibalanus amphitrite]XP_043244167.1 Golgi resident protein GCP60-like isoform X1 [Amphibalanus amphitrite]XP_043244169.1 Golgi resident protein GCP60-like isoform X1 [Amphibalanus amphitrite]
MATDDVKEATEGVGALSVTEKASNGVSEKWGLELQHLYHLAVKFYKDNSGKVLQPSYEQKLQLSALQQQSVHGPCRPDALPPLGVLDVIGRDRRQAWQALGELSRPEAMTRYIELLDSVCATFRPYAEAHKCDLEAKQRKLEEAQNSARQELQEQEEGRQRLEQMAIQQEQEEARRQEETKRHIKEALNQQTRAQFRAYAEQQYPGSPDQQAVLIEQLQEQHYQQYMQQLYQQQLQQQQQQQRPAPVETSGGGAAEPQPAGASDHAAEPAAPAVPAAPASSQGDAAGTGTGAAVPPPVSAAMAAVQTPETEALLESGADRSLRETDGLLAESAGEESDSGDEHVPDVGSASMWTRKDLAEFKQAIKAEGGDAVLKVGHGETVTIRVPTHEDGTCLFWEFATDSYDIGFGVFFEWGPSEDSEVTIHISESEDEDEDPENADDPERGAHAAAEDRPLTTCVIPVYRRDCHQEVYAGSHVYPGQGVYQLKFDNSYSLWRSKTLYYRVYYTR